MDQEPKNLFEIDDKTGVIRSKQPLDREKYNSFTVRLKNELQKSVFSSTISRGRMCE